MKKAKGKPKSGVDDKSGEQEGSGSSEDEKLEGERPFKKRRLLGNVTMGVEEEVEIQQPATTVEADVKPAVVVNAQVLIHDED